MMSPLMDNLPASYFAVFAVSTKWKYSWTHVIRILKGPRILFELHEFRTKWVFFFLPDLMKKDFPRFTFEQFLYFEARIVE